MAVHKITLIPGDGTGPEIVEATKRCIEALGVSIEWEEVDAGTDAMEKYGTPLPQKVLDSIRKNKVALKGPITTPIGTGFRSVNVALRHELNLFACLRPCKLYPGIKSMHPNIDLVIVRENTEDLYAGIEFEINKPETKELIDIISQKTKKKINSDSGISIKPISVSGTRRIVKFAFEYALKNNRKKVTGVHKANIMKYSDGLFLQTFREVAKEYEALPAGRQGRIIAEDRIVDNMCMQLVKKPKEYDVLVLPNLYGDIVSDLCAGLIGGLGVAPGANFGDDIALFEAVHGSAPKYKGLNKVNPIALILSSVLMLKHIGETEASKRLENAVAQVIQEGKYLTYDLKDKDPVGTMEVAKAIIRRIEST